MNYEYYKENLQKINTNYGDKFIDLLLNTNKSYLLSRVGSVEINACHGEHLLKFPSDTIIPTKNSIDQYCKKNAGFYYVKSSLEKDKQLNERDVFHIFQNKYLNCMFESDYILIYSFHLDCYNKLYKSVSSKLNYKILYEELDFYLLLLEYYTNKLNKKILIVSNFTSSMIKQLGIYKELFPSYNIKPENFVFYNSYQTIQGNTPHNNWYETYKVMEEDIGKLEFDYVFLGCGCYGLPLSNHIHKKMNKSVFYIGATIQLLFGIIGKRWGDRLKNPKYWINKYYNDKWVKPTDEQIPNNFKNVEGGCYW